MHVDFDYKIGSNADCSFPVCCRDETNGVGPIAQSSLAGKWGSYNCDIPLRTLESMLTYIREEVKPDIAVWTGDSLTHHIWNNSNEEVINKVKRVSQLVKQQIGADTQVYPISGNHDSFPANLFNFNSPNT